MKGLLPAVLLAASTLLADGVSHREAAVRLLQVSHADRMMDGFLTTYQDSLRQGFEESGGGPEHDAIFEKYSAEVVALLGEVMAWEKVETEVVDLYVAELTEPELRELIAFYETPTGKKLLERVPALMQGGAEIGQRRAAAVLPQLQAINDRMAEELILTLESDSADPQP